jgi:hypothetical protein
MTALQLSINDFPTRLPFPAMAASRSPPAPTIGKQAPDPAHLRPSRRQSAVNKEFSFKLSTLQASGYILSHLENKEKFSR